MAYNRKTWKNRSSQYPTRRRLAKVSESDLEMIVDVSREEGTISQTGDQFSASSMNDLEGRIEAAFNELPDIPEGIIGDTDISEIADGTLTGAVTELNSEIADIVNVYGAKNLLRYPYYETTRTLNGITYTDNGDGTVTANGTASGGNAVFIIDGVSTTANMLKPNTTYRFSAGDFTGSTSTLWVRIYIYNTAMEIAHTINLIGEEIVYTTPNDLKGINAQIVILNGQTVSNLVFKPMIRLASIQDDTYVPYAKTNKELTDAFASDDASINNQAKDIEPGNTATSAHSKGDYIIYGASKKFAEVLSNISVGDTLSNATGGNIKDITQGEVLTELNSALRQYPAANSEKIIGYLSDGTAVYRKHFVGNYTNVHAGTNQVVLGTARQIVNAFGSFTRIAGSLEFRQLLFSTDVTSSGSGVTSSGIWIRKGTNEIRLNYFFSSDADVTSISYDIYIDYTKV